MAKEEPRSTANGILFTVSVNAVTHHCLISKKALNKLSQLKNIDSSDADAIDVFKAFESYIQPVAHELLKAKPPLKTLRLTTGSINSAFDCGTTH